MVTITNDSDGVKNELLPDLDQAQSYLNLLAPNEPVTFQTIDDNKSRKDRKLARILHGTLEQHARELFNLNLAGAGIFVMVNRGDLKGRRGANVQSVRALFVDLDGSPLDPVLEAPLKPDIIVETSPQRYQALWIVDGIALEEFTFWQQQLAARFGGDPEICDLPRVSRIPGFFHRKGEPFLVRLLQPKTRVTHV